ncbi:MAG: hypothetical protein LBQ66_05355 [Planctomycetaceae bacterium]|jgi:hypothetical protein|nr:hypothetical protein [Planctomycetaceae bacterium]
MNLIFYKLNLAGLFAQRFFVVRLRGILSVVGIFFAVMFLGYGLNYGGQADLPKGVSDRESEQFRIDNELVAGKYSVKSVMYFLDKDFLGQIGGNGEMTHYSASRDSFTLLMPSLRIQTRLSATETRNEVESLVKSVTVTKEPIDPRLMFVVKPVFKIDADNNSGQMSLQSAWVDYKLTTENLSDANISKKYFDFCDLSCYLNCRVASSYRPLFRLEVNRILRKENLFPKTISTTFYPNGKIINAQEENITSKHKIIKRLTNEDKTKINQILSAMDTFKTVTFEEYQKAIKNEK